MMINNNEQVIKPVDRYCFVVEWFDVHAQLTRQYNLYYCPEDSTVEMFDLKSRKTFLRRTRIEEDIKLSSFYLGSSLNLFSRQLQIVNFGDAFTRSKLEISNEKTFLVVKPNGYLQLGIILNEIFKNNNMSEFNLTGLKMLDFEEVFVRHLAFKKEEERFGEEFGNRCTVFRLNKANAVEELVSLVETSPVLSKLKNLFYVPKNPAEVKETLNLVFGQENSNGGMKRTSTLYKGNKDQRKYFQTLCLIKPHAVNKFEHGSIINEILKENYFISDMELFNLESANAEEFLEVYKDVVPEYHLMLDQLTSGILVALEISGKNENIVCEFRNFCGPSDPELGRLIRPQTLRSKFGTDKIKNSVHCTDLTDDGVLEAEYFFKILVD